MPKKILHVNACIRDDETSRTAKLGQYMLGRLQKKEPDAVIEEVRLAELGLLPFNAEMIEKRDEALKEERFGDEMFRYANQFIEADLVVITAPYWDLSYPAVLKVYAEHISVNGISFAYNEEGNLVGKCRAKKIIYVTTSGGYIGEHNHGYDYIRGLGALYSIPEVDFISCEGLDIWGTDVEAKIREAKEKIDSLCADIII